jgi:GNAT superfamily N-acetyltransferase
VNIAGPEMCYRCWFMVIQPAAKSKNNLNLTLNSILITWILIEFLLRNIIKNLMVGCFCVAESIKNCDNRNYHQVSGTIAIRNLKQFESRAELKLYVSRQFRKLGIGQKMLDTAIDFAKGFGCKRIVLDSSKYLHPASILYLKKGFVHIPITTCLSKRNYDLIHIASVNDVKEYFS